MISRQPYRNSELHPKAREVFALLAHRLEEGYRNGNTPTLFKPFEGFRTPERQDFLYTVEKSTKAKGWQSAHNYGLAVDFVPLSDAKNMSSWSWEGPHDWAFLNYWATQLGLSNTIVWDRPHVEHPIWSAIKRQVV